MSALSLDTILAAVKAGENADWELKSARGGFPGSFWETYSGMANTEGGTIVLGVTERPDGVRLDGLDAERLARYRKILWDSLNDRGKVSANLLGVDDVEAVPVGDTHLLTVRVPRATRTQRPVFLGAGPLGHTYRRRHEGDYRCSDAEVRRMLSDADPEPADQRILTHFGREDLDPTSLRQYRQRLGVAKGDHPWVALPDEELLERLGAWRRDRASGAAGLTLAGLLMFGKDGAIRDAQAVPGYFVDYREKLDPVVRWTDRIYPDGTWEPNLFQFYQRVWLKLAAGLPTPFRLEGAERRDVTPAHEALREAFVNALIHADYAAAGGVVVERYPDRFVLENPGTLLVSLEQYQRGGVSECRNKALQQMFLMIGGGERAGSGVDKIRSGWRAHHWRSPRLDVRLEPDRVALTMPMISLIPEETLVRLRSRFGAEVDARPAGELQALATADIEGSVSNARLQELMAEHPVDISRMLTRLCDEGLLVSDNRRRWTTYRLWERSPHLAESSPHSEGSSSHSNGSSSHSDGSSSHSNAKPAPILEKPLDLSALRETAGPVATRSRVATAAMRAMIRRLCAGRYLTLAELADLLNRTPANLRNRHIAQMLSDGHLRARFPTTPNHPDQAYTATTTEDR